MSAIALRFAAIIVRLIRLITVEAVVVALRLWPSAIVRLAAPLPRLSHRVLAAVTPPDVAVMAIGARLIRRQRRRTTEAAVKRLVGPAAAVGIGMVALPRPLGLAVVVMPSSIPRFGGAALMELR